MDVVAVLLSLPVAVLVVEVLCALTVKNDIDYVNVRRRSGLRVAVLVPAHDEEDGIGVTISGIAKQLAPSDRLVVVADNCTDTTTERARAAGAEVIERLDPERRGKGYALDFGVHHLGGDPPDIVVVVDADCRLGFLAIDLLAACVERNARPAQAFNVVLPPPDSEATHRVAGFAWIVKNHVRPAGLAALGLPCQLMGTGMAFPWEAIKRINLASDNIVEDVKMGLDLAAAGFAPVYCPGARVDSDFPTTEHGFVVQRQRWETGSLRVAIKIAPAMFLRGLVGLNVPLMAMAGDLMVPPLMMLLAILTLWIIFSAILVIAGGSAFPLAMFGGSLLILVLTLALAWVRFGRDVLLPRDVLALPGVFVSKLGLYVAMWRGRGVGWIRTDRR